MNDLWLAIFIQAAGVALLVLEMFVPSHGAFGVLGVGGIVAGVYMAFRLNLAAGYGSLATEALVVPTVLAVGLRMFRRTPIGRIVVPPNPVLTAADTSVDVTALRGLIGARGRSVSPLRPVGTCVFDGRRVQCVAESGLIEPGAEVEGVGIIGASLSVRLSPKSKKS